MGANGIVCLFLLTLLTKDGRCTAPETALRTERGGNLKEFAGDDDPNFWPVRGRRSDRYPEPWYPFRRGGRRAREDETGVFWAGRGRSYDPREVADAEEDKFWAHRGRFAVEEPAWVWVARREPDPPAAGAKPEEEVVLCSGKNNQNEKREYFRQRLCHLKRKANALLRDLPAQSEQFWPVRGKKWREEARRERASSGGPSVLEEETFWPVRGKREEEGEGESWQELRDLKTFWPARGRRGGTPPKEISNGKEVT